jgi:hypothetical protein
MPYKNLVNDLNEKCQFELNDERLFEQVKYAMSRPAAERNAALKNVIKYNFPEDCGEYNEIRMKYNLHYIYRGASMTIEDERNKQRMHNIPRFFMHYLDIVTEMVKDIDPNHKVLPFLGLTQQETVDMQLEIADRISRKESFKYELFEVKGLDGFYEDIKLARADKQTKEVHQYSTASEAVKSGIESVYMMKKLVEEELKERGWIWRIMNWFGEAKPMRDIIKAAEKTLKEVKFPNDRKTKDAVKEKYNQPAVYAMDKEIIVNYAAKIYDEYKNEYKNALKAINDNKDKDIAAAADKDGISAMFDVRFRPSANVDELKGQITIGNQISKEYVHNNRSLDPTVKKVFNANMQKLSVMKDHWDKYADPKRNRSEEEIQNHLDGILKQFDKAERDFIYNNPNYVPVTIEDVQKAMTVKEPVTVDVEGNNKGNIEMSKPVEIDPTAKKEPVVKE